MNDKPELPRLRLATWAPAVIDKPWKKRIAFASRERAISTINGLGAILFDGTYPGAAPTDFEAQCEVIAKLSGREIADQMRRYWRVANTELERSKDISTED